MAFQQESNKVTGSDSSDDFENGGNIKEKGDGTELEIIDRSRFEKEVKESYNNFDEKFKMMSIKQKTNYFVRSMTHAN